VSASRKVTSDEVTTTTLYPPQGRRDSAPDFALAEPFDDARVSKRLE
jgi:hypothetical protein